MRSSLAALLAVILSAAAALMASAPLRTDHRLRDVALSGRRPAALEGSLVPPPRAGPRRRRHRNLRSDSRPRPHDQEQAVPWLLTPPARTALAAAAGFGLFVTVGGLAGAISGSVVLVALPRLIARLPDPTAAAGERRLSQDLPLALDLVAACLATGAPLGQAVSAVGLNLPGPLSRILASAARQLELGAAPEVAWKAAASYRPLQATVETVTRVGQSGAALAPALHALAAQERERANQAQEAALRRVGVFVVLPLGACFLPAFLLLGVVPIVAGLVGGLLI